MDLQDIHNRLLFLANKETNYWTSGEMDNTLHIAQMWKFIKSRDVYAKDQQAQENLAPFKVPYTFTPNNTPGGMITFDATNYLYFLGLYTQYFNNQTQRTDYNSVRIIGEDELAYRLKSQLTPVTVENPVATVTGLGIYQLYPQVPNTGKAFYLKNPAPPKLVFTMQGRTKTYNKNNSTQLEWSDTCINEIIIKALQLLGININDAQLLQFTEVKDQQKI